MFAIVGGVVIDFYSRDTDLAFGGHAHAFTVLGGLVAVLVFGCGIWAWSIRHVALSIDTQSGEVRFGTKQLCRPGTVASVLVRCPSSLPEDEESYFFEFRLNDGTVVGVPSPAFVDIGNVECATVLAERVAAKLKVRMDRDY